MELHLPPCAIRNNKCLRHPVSHMDCRRACPNNTPLPGRWSSLRCRTLNRRPSNNHTIHKLKAISQTQARDGLTKNPCLQPAILYLQSLHLSRLRGTVLHSHVPNHANHTAKHLHESQSVCQFYAYESCSLLLLVRLMCNDHHSIGCIDTHSAYSSAWQGHGRRIRRGVHSRAQRL